MGENTKNTPGQQCHWQVPSCNICSALSPLFAESAFFHTKIKNLSWNRWIYEPMGGKHQKLLLGNNAPGKCLHAHMQHFFSPSPAMRKNSLSQHFFKNLSWNHWIYEPLGAKHQKLNNSPGKCLQAHMTLAALSRKDSLSQFFSYKNQKLVMLNTSQLWQNTKNYSWATIPLASAFRPTCNISSALAALSRKNSLSQHFFPTKIKNLSWNHWIYEPMVAKHQKLLLGNNAPGKCLHAHIQHFFSPSPAMRKNSLSQHFFIQKSKTCHETVEFTSQWGQNTKNYSWATIPLASAFTPTCNISSALAPLSRKNSLSQHFFIQKNKNLSWNCWIYEPMGA